LTDTRSKQQPNWQPISELPSVARLMAEELETANDLYESLIAAQDRPHVLDDETVGRAIHLCENQLELVPTYRAQTGRWRNGSPSRSQREALSRLWAQIERFEEVVKATLVIAQKVSGSTIDAVMRMDNEDLGRALLEGRIKPPSGAAQSEDARRQEQRTIAEIIDTLVLELESTGVRDMALLSAMSPTMPLFKRLLDTAGPAGMSALCDAYPGLHRFAKVLETVAAGIQSGKMYVPR
jgi:hypothetical protein